jgi:hypothetical protein
MKNEKPKPIDVEVLPRKESSDVIIASARSVAVGRLFREHFLFCPPVYPVGRPVLSREELEASFPHRFGTAIIFVIHFVEYSVSPNGTLRAFTKLFLRWFITLSLLAIAIGVPLLIAAQFLDSIASLMESAMKHFFMASFWLIATIILWAVFIAGIVLFNNSRNKSSNSQRPLPGR